MAFQVLIIEDEQEIREIVGKYMEQAGFHVTLCRDGIEGLSKFEEKEFHLIILDVMMPIIDGFEVLRQIRVISEVPVILLTAKYEEFHRLKGFDLGVDDYVVKPFSPKELVKRAEVILKRAYGGGNGKTVLTVKPFSLDLQRLKLFRDSEEIEITTREFEVLRVFFTNPHMIFSREQLIEAAFGLDYDGFERNIDTHIKNIRQKIEADSKSPQYLKTKYGAGYYFGGDSK